VLGQPGEEVGLQFVAGVVSSKVDAHASQRIGD
jgi:hypothetical protein